MFVILCYDAASKRDPKIRKIAEKFLIPVQESVFQGNLTESKLKKLKGQLQSVIIPEEDRLRIYELDSGCPLHISQLGRKAGEESFII